MNYSNGSFVTYTKEQSTIVENGIDSIRTVLNGKNVAEKRSLLLCLDKYLDPYYGCNLSYFNDLILLLQEQLFLNDDKDIKEDILELLGSYSKNSLDYLADKIDLIDPELLGDALYALGNTYNLKYMPILIRYENHDNLIVRNTVKDALIELSKLNISQEIGESFNSTY